MQFGASVSQFKKVIILFSKDIISITFQRKVFFRQRKKYHGFYDNIN